MCKIELQNNDINISAYSFLRNHKYLLKLVIIVLCDRSKGIWQMHVHMLAIARSKQMLNPSLTVMQPHNILVQTLV